MSGVARRRRGWWPELTIARRLGLALAAVLVILLTAGAFGLSRLETGMRDVVGESAGDLAAAIMTQVEGDVTHRVEGVRELAQTTPELRRQLLEANVRRGEWGSRSEIAERIAARDLVWRANVENPPAGIETPDFIVEALGNPFSELLRQKLAYTESVAGYRVFAEIFVTDRFGANVAQTGMTSDYRQDDETWWQEGFAEGFWTSEVAFDESAGVYSLDIAVRIDGPDGEPLGVLKAALDIREVNRVLAAFESEAGAEGARFELYDRRGARLYPSFAAEPDVPGSPEAGQGDVWMAEDPETGTSRLFVSAASASRAGDLDLGWRGVLSYDAATIFAPVFELRQNLLALGLGAVILALAAGIAVSLSITRPVRVAVETARRMAQGDLTVEVDERGSGEARELLAALATMVENVRRAVTTLVEAAGHVNELARSLGEAGRKIEDGAQNQGRARDAGLAAASEMDRSIDHVAQSFGRMRGEVVETSSSVEEMATSVGSVAENAGRLTRGIDETLERARRLSTSIEGVANRAREAGEASRSAVEEARRGGAAVEQTAAGMAEIVKVIEEVDVVNSRLETSSQRIDHITEIIDGLARQTNLLALNAAIEASNAGEKGRGFAVVADEIKRLADRSAASTREIVQLIREVQEDTKRARSMTRTGVDRAHEGRGLAGKAGRALERIVETVTRVSEGMLATSRLTEEQAKTSELLVGIVEEMLGRTREVEEATTEQTRGGEQIRGAMGRIARMTEEARSVVSRHRGDGERVGEAMAEIARVTAENAATAREIVRITAALGRDADELRAVARFFELEGAKGSIPRS